MKKQAKLDERQLRYVCHSTAQLRRFVQDAIAGGEREEVEVIEREIRRREALGGVSSEGKP